MSYAHTQRQKWIASKNTLPPEQMGKRVDAGRCGSAFSQAVWLFGASQGEPQGMSEGGLFLPATSLLVPCPTVCEPSGYGVTFRTVARQIAAMCWMPPPTRCPEWIQTTTGYRRIFTDELAKGLGVPSTWFLEEGQCGLKAATLTTLLEYTCGK
jgi:hypothetical protein